MTKQQARAAVNLLSTKYPKAAIESDAELEADARDAAVSTGEYSVALNGAVVDTLDELVRQLKKDFGDDAEIQNIVGHIEALARPDVESEIDHADDGGPAPAVR